MNNPKSEGDMLKQRKNIVFFILLGILLFLNIVTAYKSLADSEKIEQAKRQGEYLRDWIVEQSSAKCSRVEAQCCDHKKEFDDCKKKFLASEWLISKENKYQKRSVNITNNCKDGKEIRSGDLLMFLMTEIDNQKVKVTSLNEANSSRVLYVKISVCEKDGSVLPVAEVKI